MQPRTSLPSWKKLVTHAQAMKDQHMSELFQQNSQRFEQFSIKLAPFLLDYSKSSIVHFVSSFLLSISLLLFLLKSVIEANKVF